MSKSRIMWANLHSQAHDKHQQVNGAGYYSVLMGCSADPVDGC
jgi:hypothetical protein